MFRLLLQKGLAGNKNSVKKIFNRNINCRLLLASTVAFVGICHYNFHVSLCLEDELIISSKQRALLHSIGYNDKDIAIIKDSVLLVILEKWTNRPRKDLPKSWLKTLDSNLGRNLLLEKKEEDKKMLELLRPLSSEYERLDTIHLSKKENKAWLKDHVIHGFLHSDNGIEVYEIYKSISSDELLCIIKFGSALNGYPGVVHGGITALMFDNSYGWLLLASKFSPAVTANLNINYR
jgi:hypothetical protein